MPATVVPFPVVRRRAFIGKTAARIAGASPRAAEKLMVAALKRQRDVLARKGVAPELVEAEVRALEVAIRAAMWRVLLSPPGGAA